MVAMITNIQRFSISDGPGIRTTVFFKGCSLQCKWCHNPEAIRHRLERVYHADMCLKCLSCVSACQQKALGFKTDQLYWNASVCNDCLACVNACRTSSLTCVGEQMTVEQVYNVIIRDIDYYHCSDGGVTVSGGEPLCQPQFVEQLFLRCQAQKISTAIETAGHVPWEAFELVLPITDLFLIDIKCMDTSMHRKYTGQGNETILENIKRLLAREYPVIIRIPLIVGVSAEDANIEQTALFLKGWDTLLGVELLPYHAFGMYKSMQLLGNTDLQKRYNAPDTISMRRYGAIFKRHGIRVIDDCTEMPKL